eukprot:Tamp_08812.p1 GENE.Tamp_08812~~Tamp_08812.p1  ORF type:complete len:621 (-),score=118.53 Tamp_08812:276-2138(-)
MSSSEEDCFECTVCLKDVRTLEGNIWQCREGHVLCAICYEQIGGCGAPCPSCNIPLSDIRNRLAEKQRARINEHRRLQRQEQATPAAAAGAREQRQEQAAQQEQATTEIQRQEQAAPAPEAGEREQWQEQAAPSPELQRPEPAAPRNPVQVEKRVRAISKKLKVAREQREAKANGQRLNVDQEAKIAGIPEMEKELAELEAWRERQRQLSAAAEQHDRGEPSEERLAPEDAGKDDAMKAKTPHSAHAPGENSAADKIGESMAKLSLGEREQEVAGHDGFTADESEALAKLLAADTAQVAQRGDGEDGSKDRDEESAGASGATQADDPSGGARNGAKSSDQRHPRLERQVFVGGLPVDVTSTLFRTWADQVFPGRVINAVLVVDRLTHSRSRGFGFITFDAVEVAEEAANQRMFSFGERMVEIKRAQNLNSKKQQNAQAQDAARGRGTKPQLNGRSNRFNVGRGAAPQGPLPPRGAAAHRGGAMGTRTVVGAGAAVHAKYQGGKAPGVWRQPNKPMPPSWTPLPHGGRGGRGGGNSAAAPHFMGPEAYGAQADGVPGGRHGPPPGWFPGVPQEQMMGYYVYPMYPGGRGRGIVPRVPVGPGPYVPPWQVQLAQTSKITNGL